MSLICKSIGCAATAEAELDFCTSCLEIFRENNDQEREAKQSLSEKYPQYYKPVGDLTEVDVYAIHMLFDIKDPSGCIQHASKKLLLSGARTGGKSVYHDIREARDTLSRWMQLYEHRQHPS